MADKPEDKKSKKGMSRRNFLEGLGAGVGAAAVFGGVIAGLGSLSGQHEPEADSPPELPLQTTGVSFKFSEVAYLHENLVQLRVLNNEMGKDIKRILLTPDVVTIEYLNPHHKTLVMDLKKMSHDNYRAGYNLLNKEGGDGNWDMTEPSEYNKTNFSVTNLNGQPIHLAVNAPKDRELALTLRNSKSTYVPPPSRRPLGTDDPLGNPSPREAWGPDPLQEELNEQFEREQNSEDKFVLDISDKGAGKIKIDTDNHVGSPTIEVTGLTDAHEQKARKAVEIYKQLKIGNDRFEFDDNLMLGVRSNVKVILKGPTQTITNAVGAGTNSNSPGVKGRDRE